MHLIERYATSCGVKINKPELYLKYFPMPADKYVLLYSFNPKTNTNYDHWDIVIQNINQFLLPNNIKIIQIGVDKNKKYNNTIFLDQNAIDFQNLGYLIKNAELILSVDGVVNHIASLFNKKIVSIYSNINIENVKPYWGDKTNHYLIEPNVSTKPFYGANGSNKNINLIKPEQIITGVFKLLGLKFDRMLNTIFIGSNFHNKTLDIIPDGPIDLQKISNIDNVIVRMDLSYNENMLEYILKFKKCLIVTNKPIDINLIKNYKNNIIKIVYVLDDNNQVDFIKNIKNININYLLISEEDDKKIEKYKVNYMDYGLILKKEKNKKPKELNNIKEGNFLSSKIYYSFKGIFNTKYAWINNISNLNTIVDDNIFWEDLQDLHIFTIDKI